MGEKNVEYPSFPPQHTLRTNHPFGKKNRKDTGKIQVEAKAHNLFPTPNSGPCFSCPKSNSSWEWPYEQKLFIMLPFWTIVYKCLAGFDPDHIDCYLSIHRVTIEGHGQALFVPKHPWPPSNERPRHTFGHRPPWIECNVITDWLDDARGGQNGHGHIC